MSGYMHQNVEQYIATVNGEKISLTLFQNMYAIEQKRQKKILGNKFKTFQKSKKFKNDTYKYVLFQLINNVLLEQYTKKIGLDINDNKIKNIILNSNLFQNNQKFDKEKYFQYLSSVNLTHQEYVNLIKKKMNTEYIIDAIADNNILLEKEKIQIIKLLSQKRMIKEAKLDVHNFEKTQNVTDLEKENYFKKNKKYFYLPEKFKLNFIKIQLNNFQSTCNKNEITKWYLKNTKKYSTKEQRQYSLIQVQKKEDALSIISALNKNKANFSNLAKEKSIDPISSKNNGNLGWMFLDAIPDEIKQAKLTKENQISTLIPFKNSFLIIKLNKILKSHKKKLKEVYNTIEKEIKHQKSLFLYHQLQNTISSTIKKHPHQLDLILKKNNLVFQETDWFDLNSIPDELNIPIVKTMIFNKSVKNKYFKKSQQYSHLIILNKNQSFLIKIQDFKNKKMQKFEDVKNDIIKKIKFIKAIKAAKEMSKKILFNLQQGDESLFKRFNLKFQHVQNLSRYDNNPITSIVFSLPHPTNRKHEYALYQDQNKNIIIIALEKVYYEDFYEKEKKMIIEYLEKNNTEMIISALLKNLHETSKITYETIKNM